VLGRAGAERTGAMVASVGGQLGPSPTALTAQGPGDVTKRGRTAWKPACVEDHQGTPRPAVLAAAAWRRPWCRSLLIGRTAGWAGHRPRERRWMLPQQRADPNRKIEAGMARQS